MAGCELTFAPPCDRRRDRDTGALLGGVDNELLAAHKTNKSKSDLAATCPARVDGAETEASSGRPATSASRTISKPRAARSFWARHRAFVDQSALLRRPPRRRTCSISTFPHTPQAEPTENLHASGSLWSCAPKPKRTRDVHLRNGSIADLSLGDVNDSSCSRRLMVPSLKRKPTTSSRSCPGAQSYSME
ncbi:MAG: hypothetical protein JWP08_1926 [Bryobacterales bacterium]|nr:hypothetical protein [Bryobacterales bacterium]